MNAIEKRSNLEFGCGGIATIVQADNPLRRSERENTLLDSIHADKLDEADQAARKFPVRFPDVYDGYDLLGMVYEARDDNKKAADDYRKAIDFIRERPDQSDTPELEAALHRLVAKLDPPAPPVDPIV
jgi:tetratricopeptide (TPR) repeat protein